MVNKFASLEYGTKRQTMQGHVMGRFFWHYCSADAEPVHSRGRAGATSEISHVLGCFL